MTINCWREEYKTTERTDYPSSYAVVKKTLQKHGCQFMRFSLSSYFYRSMFNWRTSGKAVNAHGIGQKYRNIAIRCYYVYGLAK